MKPVKGNGFIRLVAWRSQRQGAGGGGVMAVVGEFAWLLCEPLFF